MKLSKVFLVVFGMALCACDSNNRLSEDGSFFESRAGTVWDAPMEEQPDAIHVRVGSNENLPFESWLNKGGVFGECYEYFPYGLTDGGLEYEIVDVTDLSSDVLQVTLESEQGGESIREFHTYFIDGEFLVNDFERYANEIFVGRGSRYFTRSSIDVDALEICNN